MAKICACGAEEQDRFEAGKWVYVYTSDKRVLCKLRGERFKLVRRNVLPQEWQGFKARCANKTA